VVKWQSPIPAWGVRDKTTSLGSLKQKLWGSLRLQTSERTVQQPVTCEEDSGQNMLLAQHLWYEQTLDKKHHRRVWGVQDEKGNLQSDLFFFSLRSLGHH
jgi:hypothetical protein